MIGTLNLLDLASPQGAISAAEWTMIAASGVVGVYCKCGNGNNPPDPTFAANVAGARSVGIVPGYYAVGFPLPEDGVNAGRGAVEQAQAHFAQAAGLGIVLGDLRPCLDFEWPLPVDWPHWKVTPKNARTWALTWLDETRRLSGRVPLIYLYPDFQVHLFAGVTPEELEQFARYPLWLAHYGVEQPGTLRPWAAPTLWQKSDGGARLPSGRSVDEDVFLGDADAWEAFRGSP
jgi:GH25 family lysozyme M1 (1,4-beta-N-acetylmuramidase)